MDFPFIPIGAALATIVLAGAFSLLYLLVTRLDRAVVEVGGGVVARLVTGLDDWNHRPPAPDPHPGNDPSSPVDVPFEDAPAVPVERSRRI